MRRRAACGDDDAKRPSAAAHRSCSLTCPGQHSGAERPPAATRGNFGVVALLIDRHGRAARRCVRRRPAPVAPAGLVGVGLPPVGLCVHRLPSCPGLRGVASSSCAGLVCLRPASLPRAALLVRSAAVSDRLLTGTPRTSGRRSRRTSDSSAIGAGAGAMRALAAARPIPLADVGTAFSSPPSPVDFSADVAASVRR